MESFNLSFVKKYFPCLPYVIVYVCVCVNHSFMFRKKNLNFNFENAKLTTFMVT